MTAAVVGRDFELAQISQAVATGVSGSGTVVLLAGEPGIGKSRLVAAARESALARHPGLVTASGACWEGGGAPPYWPWTQVLRSLEEVDAIHDLIAPAAAALASASASAPDDEPESARFALFDTVATALGGAARRAPLLIAIEDAHAADAPSLLLLHLLHGVAATAPLTVLVTFRPVELRQQPALDEIVARIAARGTHVAVGGLAAADLGRLIKTTLDLHLPTAVEDAVHAATDGNPLHALEIVQLLAGSGQLDVWRPGEALPVPVGVRAVLRMRVGNMSAETARIVGMAALSGAAIDVTVLAAAADVAVDRCLDHLGEAQSLGIVEPLEGATRGWRFRHALVRDAVAEQLEPAERARLHLAVANAIERLHPDGLERDAALAHHHAAALPVADPTVVAHWCSRAAARALDHLAYEDAAALARQAVEVASAHADAHVGVELRLLLQRALRALARFEEAEEVAREASSLARATASPALRAEAALACITEADFETQWDVITELEDVELHLPPAADALRARVMAGLARLLQWEPTRTHERIGFADRAVELARASNDPDILFNALQTAQLTRWNTEFDAGTTIVDEMISVARELADPQVRLYAMVWAALVAARSGDGRALSAAVRALERLASDVPQPVFRWWADVVATSMLLGAGRLDEAQRVLDNSVGSELVRGIPRSVDQCLAVQQMQVARRRLDLELIRLLRAGIPTFLARWHQASPWAPAAVLLDAFSGDHAAAVATARALLGTLDAVPDDANRSSSLALLAEACDALELDDDVTPLYDALIPVRGTFVVLGLGWEVYGPVDQYLGQLCRLLGRHDDAIAHFDEALAMIARLDAPSTEAITRHYYARALHDAGRAAEATTQAAAARALAVALGMDGWVERIDAIAPALPAVAPISFERRGDVWVVVHGGRVAHVPTSKGMQHLAALVAAPGRSVPAVTLAGSVSEGDLGPVLDDAAKAAYRRRIDALRATIDAALERGAAATAERAQDELDQLVDELSRATGLGGRDRRPGGAAERARLNVTRTIRSAIERVAAVDADAGSHLAESVITGTHCTYRPKGVHSG